MEAEQETIGGTDTEPVRYAIDPGWYETRGRDFVAFVGARFCPSCQQQLGSEREERVPTVDSTSGTVVFEPRRVSFGANPLAVIRDCCSKWQGYVPPGLPSMEVIFRIALANGNRPMTPDELQVEIQDWSGPGDRARLLSVEMLRRMLARDRFYGFQPADAAED